MAYGFDENKNKITVPVISEILDIFFPVGSYYETSDGTFDPNVKWGGTWAKDSDGRVTVAVDESDDDLNAGSKTGGEKNHVLNIDEMPSHNHDCNVSTTTKSAVAGTSSVLANSGNSFYTISGTIRSVEILNKGEGLAHNNMQPYVTVYRWHRTA